MPLYIYSLVRRGVTPEINALSTTLLVASIGLVGLSLTAQSGGVVYTRAMSLGAGLGLGLYGLFSLTALFASFTIGGLVVRLLLIVAFAWMWRSYKPYREELNLINASGRILAWIALFVSASVAYLSAFLLLG